MQIATLNYQFGSQENVNADARARHNQRHVLTSLVKPQKKHKPRQSLHSDPSFHSNPPLPPIPAHGKRPSSIRIQGSSLTAGKLIETTPYSFHPQPRSRSRNSEQLETAGARSRSVTPTGVLRPTSRFVRLKFGYPVKLRSAQFYTTEKNETELRSREELFVNDSVRSAHQSRRSSIIPPYEPMTDPHLRQFFQSPAVLDVVRKTMSREQDNSYKSDERSSNTSKMKRRSRTIDPNDYHRIVTKGSSGYGRLNGYDCIPLSSPARNYHNRSSALDGSASNLAYHSSMESRPRRSTTREKVQASANTSVQSFPTHSSNPAGDFERKKTLRKYDRNKPPKPIATSSPLRHPLRQLVEESTPLLPIPSTAPAATKDTDADVPELVAEARATQD